MRAAPPLERLAVGQVLVQTGRVYARDFLWLIGLALVVRGPGVVAEGWLSDHMAAALAARPTAAILPWLVGFIPFALADGAIVWVALRRLGGRGPSLGGLGG